MIFIRLHKGHALRQLSPGYLGKHLVIRPCKYHIHIIIPWDKALMAHGSEESPGVQRIFDLIFSTDPIDFL